MSNAKLKIDPEFEALCPKLSPEERSMLETGINRDGCLESIAVWGSDGETILDGHNRYAICTSLGKQFATKPITAESRHDAINWIIAKQLGRRNLTDEQKSYLRGKRYMGERGDQHSHPKIDDQIGRRSGDVREKIAAEYGVGAMTIQRDAQFARAVDRLGETDGADAKQAVLSGASGLSHAAVRAGKKPGEAGVTLRAALRSQRAKEKATNGHAVAAAISQQSVADIATKGQKRLIELCESIKRLAAIVDALVTDSEALKRAADKESWTPHAKTRVRADLAGIKRDIGRLDYFLK